MILTNFNLSYLVMLPYKFHISGLLDFEKKGFFKKRFLSIYSNIKVHISIVSPLSLGDYDLNKLKFKLPEDATTDILSFWPNFFLKRCLITV